MNLKLLTIEDLCKQLGIGKTTAYKIAKSIKHTKIGRRILIPEETIEEYVSEKIHMDHKH